MGVPAPDMEPVADSSAEAVLGALRTIAAPERRKHASVYNYWLSIRGSRQFPPIRDLDPLEISDAGPFSLLLEMIGGGEDAEIRHIGQAIKGDAAAEKVGDAPASSLLSCIARRLPVVAACREAFAFEDEFDSGGAKTRCWVTLLPFSATGTWIDFVYGFVSLGAVGGAVPASPPPGEVIPETEPDPEEIAEAPADLGDPNEASIDDATAANEADDSAGPGFSIALDDTPDDAEVAPAKPTLSAKFFETLANVGGFYGRTAEIELDLDSAILETGEHVQEDEPAPAPEPQSISEGTLQSKLTELRAKADEARAAKLRANAALYEGLGAAYDFALDAEDSPEEYLRLVEAEGLKIQLRSPMKPVAKLAFAGMCDDCTIQQLEAILAWAFDEELPRGSLAGRIEEAGGIAAILGGEARAAA